MCEATVDGCESLHVAFLRQLPQHLYGCLPDSDIAIIEEISHLIASLSPVFVNFPALSLLSVSQKLPCVCVCAQGGLTLQQQ